MNKNVNKNESVEMKKQMIRIVREELFFKLAKLGFCKKRLYDMDMYQDCLDESILIAMTLEGEKDYLLLGDVFRIMNEGIEDFIKSNFSEYINRDFINLENIKNDASDCIYII